MANRVVITGIGIWSCLGTNVEAVKDSLHEGKSGIGVDEERLGYGYHSALTGIVSQPVIELTLNYSQESRQSSRILIKKGLINHV